jgi:hypothetical protein
MINRLLLSAFACVAALPADAATIAWQAAIDNGFALSDSATLLPVQSMVRLGYFAQGFTNQMAAQNSTSPEGLALIAANFNQIDVARIGQGTPVSQAGYFAASETFAVAGGIEGRQLVMWVFHSTDNSSFQRSFETAVETGIFYMDGVADNRWRIPSDDVPPAATGIDIEQLTGAGPTGGLLAGANLVVGRYSDNTFGPLQARQFLLQPVPEPSTAVLLALSGFCVAARRYRRG